MGGKDFLPYNKKAVENFFDKKAREEEAAAKKKGKKWLFTWVTNSFK